MYYRTILGALLLASSSWTLADLKPDVLDCDPKKAGRNAAHWHDGARCLPVDEDSPVDRQGTQPAPDAVPSTDSVTDFGQLCGDLRRRLKEVVANN